MIEKILSVFNFLLSLFSSKKDEIDINKMVEINDEVYDIKDNIKDTFAKEIDKDETKKEIEIRL